jgi:Flp pilus assembly protein TadB
VILSDQSKKYIYIALAVILALVAVYWFSSRDNRSGIEPSRIHLQSVGTKQQDAGNKIDESKRIAEEVGETNSDALREVDDSRTINKSSAEFIAEGKSILSNIRKRSQGREK